MKVPKPLLSLCCPEHGPVSSALQRKDLLWGETRVPDALGYFCPRCGNALSIPQVTSGRIGVATRRSQQNEGRLVFLSKEVEDFAFIVQTTLGLPQLEREAAAVTALHLGLAVAGRRKTPRSHWKDYGSPRGEACWVAAPHDLWVRINGLRKAWSASTDDDVVRWLIVAAGSAATAGLSSLATDEEVSA